MRPRFLIWEKGCSHGASRFCCLIFTAQTRWFYPRVNVGNIVQQPAIVGKKFLVADPKERLHREILRRIADDENTLLHKESIFGKDGVRRRGDSGSICANVAFRHTHRNMLFKFRFRFEMIYTNEIPKRILFIEERESLRAVVSQHERIRALNRLPHRCIGEGLQKLILRQGIILDSSLAERQVPRGIHLRAGCAADGLDGCGLMITGQNQHQTQEKKQLFHGITSLSCRIAHGGFVLSPFD